MASCGEFQVKYMIVPSVLLCLVAGCTSLSVGPFGPFPSSPLSLFLSGKPTALPIGTPEPPTADDQFLLKIENQDDGAGRCDNMEPDLPLVTFVQITNLQTGTSIGSVELLPCQLVYAVIDCLDRPVAITCIFPDGETDAATVQMDDHCIDRSYYILRELNWVEVDEDDDGEPDGELVADNRFWLAQSNSQPRCTNP